MAHARSTTINGRPSALLAAMLMLAFAAIACRSLVPDGPLPGSRQLVFPVNNESALPVTVVVADESSQPPFALQTHVIPPNTRVDVLFTVPPTEHWAIFINPGQRPDTGPMVIAHDVARCTGRVPIEILIQPPGNVVWMQIGVGPSCVTP